MKTKSASIELSEAQAALLKGDTDKADILFRQIEENSQKVIEQASKPAAKAAFHQGIIAQENYDYSTALTHYVRALHYCPENHLYVSEVANMNKILFQ